MHAYIDTHVIVSMYILKYENYFFNQNYFCKFFMKLYYMVIYGPLASINNKFCSTKERPINTRPQTAGILVKQQSSPADFILKESSKIPIIQSNLNNISNNIANVLSTEENRNYRIKTALTKPGREDKITLNDAYKYLLKSKKKLGKYYKIKINSPICCISGLVDYNIS